GEHAYCDGGIHMRPRHAAIGEGENHDGQAMSEGNRDDAGQADAVADHGRGAGSDEHESKGADELRKKLGCNTVGHCGSPETSLIARWGRFASTTIVIWG